MKYNIVSSGGNYTWNLWNIFPFFCLLFTAQVRSAMVFFTCFLQFLNSRQDDSHWGPCKVAELFATLLSWSWSPSPVLHLLSHEKWEKIGKAKDIWMFFFTAISCLAHTCPPPSVKHPVTGNEPNLHVLTPSPLICHHTWNASFMN